MARLWAIIRKDLVRRWRSPLAILVLLAFPVLLSLLIALAFGGGGSPKIPRVRLLIENRDQGLVGNLVVAAFGSKQMADHFDIELVGEEGRSRLDRGKASALLVIPEGLTRALLDGEPATLELVRNPAQGIMPEIAEQAVTVLVDLLDGGGRLLRGPLDQLSSVLGDERQASDLELAQLAISTRAALDQVSGLLFPPAIELATSTAAGEKKQDSPASSVFLLVLPGISVMALFLVGEQSMRDLRAEQDLGTLRRQMAGPFGVGTIVVGKALYTACVAAIGVMILAAIGGLAGARGVSLGGFLILSAAMVLAVTGFTCAIFGLAGSQRHGTTVSSIFVLAMAGLGGSFVPLQNLPPAIRRFSPLSLIYWGNTGYSELLHGADLLTIVTSVGVLTVVGLVLLLLGSWVLERRILAGK